jgi:hypothetical protein
MLVIRNSPEVAVEGIDAPNRVLISTGMFLNLALGDINEPFTLGFCRFGATRGCSLSERTVIACACL